MAASSSAVPDARRAGRRGLLGASLAAFAGTARAANFAYRLGTDLPAAHPLNTRLQQVASRIRTATHGQLAIEIYPDSQLGEATEMLGAAQSGTLQLVAQSALVLARLVPEAALPCIPFAFHDTARLWPAMDGALGGFVRDAIRGNGLVALGCVWDGGFHQITTTERRVSGPSDLHGLRLALPASLVLQAMARAFGITPAEAGPAELYSVLQSRGADGASAPLPLIDLARLYEVQRNCALTAHVWEGYWLLANAAAFEALSAAAKSALTTALDAACIAERADVAALDARLVGGLQKNGVALTTPDPEPFRAVLRQAGFYADWRKICGEPGWRLLQAASGALPG